MREGPRGFGPTSPWRRLRAAAAVVVAGLLAVPLVATAADTDDPEAAEAVVTTTTAPPPEESQPAAEPAPSTTADEPPTTTSDEVAATTEAPTSSPETTTATVESSAPATSIDEPDPEPEPSTIASAPEPESDPEPAAMVAAAVEDDPGVGIMAVPPGFTEFIDFGAVRVGERGEWFPVRYASAISTHVGSTVGIEVSTAGGHSCDATSCAVDARFVPFARGPFSGYVHFLTTEGEVQVPAVGIGLDTEVSLTPPFSSAGDVVVGSTSAPLQLTFANVGDFPVNVTAVSVSAPFERSGGTCAAPGLLGVGASCTIQVVFRPTTTGSASGTVSVSTLEEPPAQAVVSGNGLSNTPSVSVSPSAFTFPGTVVGSTSAPTTFTITNTGHVPVTLGGSAITTSSADWVLGASTCAAVLPPATSCTQVVSFSPTAAGNRTGTLRVETGATPATSSLSGFGEVRTYTLTPEDVDFGGVRLGSSAMRNVVVRNTGNVDLLLSSVTTPGAVTAAAAGCTAPIAPSSTCTIGLTFAPTQAGLMSGSLTVASSFGTRTASLRGVGEPLQADAASVDVGPVTVGHTGTATVTVRNLASVAVPLTIAAPGTGFEVGTCPDPLPAGAACELTVTFLPESVGPASSSFVVSSSLPGDMSQDVTIAVAGAGVPAELVGTPVDFGNVALSETGTASLTITNAGAAPVELVGLAVDAPFALGDPAPCVTVLAPTGTCTVTVTFTPDVPGAATADVVVSHLAGDTPLPVTGFGATAGLDAGVEQLDFGLVLAGTASAPDTITVRNTGNVDATLDAATVSGPFELVDDRCAGVLAPDATCEIDVRFTPAADAAGDQSGLLAITADGDGGPAATSVELLGFAVVAQLGVTPTAHDFGVVALGRPAPQLTITVSNDGNVPVVLEVLDVVDPMLTLDTSACAGVSLDPGTTCELVAGYTPTAEGIHEVTSAVTGTIEVAAGPHTLGPVELALRGEGAAPVITGDAEEVDFDEAPVGEATEPRTVVVTNDGPEVTITGVEVPEGFVVVDDGCTGVVLGTGESCEILVRFEPTEPGETTGDLVVTADATGATITVALRGFAPDGELVVGPTTIDFGDVTVGARSPEETITITNGMNTPITVTNVMFGAPVAVAADSSELAAPPPMVAGAFQVEASACAGVTLQPGESCTVTAAFAPTVVGVATETVAVETDRGAASVTLQGTGVAAPTTTVAGGRLPATGATTGPAPLVVAVLLVAAGAAVVLSVRRRSAAG